MASGHQFSFGGFTTSCLDGVPFRIGSRFLPPQKVILPQDLELARPAISHTADTEYTFEVEEAVLKWSEERLRQIEEQRMYEEERLASVEQQNGEQLARDSESGGNESQSGITTAGSLNSPDYENTRALGPQLPPRPNIKPYVAVPNPLLANISNDILKPIPFNQTGDSDLRNITNASPKDSSASAFDVTLFEKEDDPFDNLELQTINDLEELKTVLEKTNETSSSPQLGLVDNKSVSSKEQRKEVVDSLDNAPTDGIPLYENVSDIKKTDSEGKTSSDSYLPPVPPRRDLVSRSIPLPPIGGFLASSVTDKSANTDEFSQNLSQSWSGTDSTQNNPTNENVHGRNGLYDNIPFASKNPIPKPRRHYKYSRYMDDTENSTTESSDETHVVDIVPKTNGDAGLGVHFQNTRSNPELHNYENTGVSRPRPVPAPRRSGSPPSRPSSEQSWNRYSPLPPPTVSYPKPVNDTTSVTSPKPTLGLKPSFPPSASPVDSRSAPSSSVPVKSPEDRLYDQLSHEARGTVDNLVLMGFNKGRVTRAVQSLGTDEKEVVEHLCLVDQLTDKGHNTFLAETALMLFNNNTNKASSYLELFSQLQELGFSGEKIKEALVKTNNDREQTLDILTATS